MNNSHALFQMKLLDSFMLESQRHNPILMSMRSTPKLFTAVVGKTVITKKNSHDSSIPKVRPAASDTNYRTGPKSQQVYI